MTNNAQSLVRWDARIKPDEDWTPYAAAQATIERLQAALFAAERRALERAAEVAEAHYDAGYGHSSLPAAIRALAGEDGT